MSPILGYTRAMSGSEYKMLSVSSSAGPVLLRYSDLGDKEKPTIVLLHGWRSEAAALSGVASALALHFRVISFDLPGFGGSKAPTSTPGQAWGIGEYTETVRVALSQLGITKASVLGHSFGGRIAISLSASHPELVTKLILVDAACFRRKHNFKNKLARLVKPLFAPAFMQGLRKKIYGAMGAADYVATPELKETFVKVISEDLSDKLSLISAETLLIWGEQDKETPVADAERMHIMIPESELEIIGDAGHFSFLDQPEMFNKVLLEFLQ